MPLNVDNTVKLTISGSVGLDDLIGTLTNIQGGKNAGVPQEVVITHASVAQNQRDDRYVTFIVRDKR